MSLGVTVLATDVAEKSLSYDCLAIRYYLAIKSNLPWSLQKLNAGTVRTQRF